MNRMDIYNILPVFGQNMACEIQGKKIKRDRYGTLFYKKLMEYESHKLWTEKEIENLQNDKLKKIVKHCHENVPFYKNYFNESGVDYKLIQCKEDLIKLPILTKKDVKEHINEFVDKNIQLSKTFIHATGGTTGSGLKFRTNNEEEMEQWAVWWRYRRNLEIDINQLCGLFGGKTVVPVSVDKPPFWRFNFPCNQVYFSGFHINKETWKYYCKCIEKYQIKWIHGYPSIIAILARYMLDNNYRMKLDIVTTGAENLTELQKKNICDAFLDGKDKVYQHYGLTEGVANISQSLDGEFKIDNDFAAIELMDYRGDLKKIIGTSLTNYVMPLLRYDTGDLVSLNEAGKIQSFNGRDAECIYLKKGGVISGATFNLVFKDYPHIIESQVIQKEIDNLLVKLVVNDNWREVEEDFLKKEIWNRVGNTVTVDFQYCKCIDKTKNGKVKTVVSLLHENVNSLSIPR